MLAVADLRIPDFLGERFTWTGAQWLLTGRLYPTSLLDAVTADQVTGIGPLPSVEATPFPELMSRELPMSAGGLKVTTSGIFPTGDHSAVEWVIAVSGDNGTTWTPVAWIGETFPTVSGLGHALPPASVIVPAGDDGIAAGAPLRVAPCAFDIAGGHSVGVDTSTVGKPQLVVEVL